MSEIKEMLIERNVKYSYPSSARVSFVRLKIMGESTLLTRPKATDIISGALLAMLLPAMIDPVDLSGIALVMAFFQKEASHHGSCRRNFSKPYTSCSEF